MAKKYLNFDGLTHLLNKLKASIALKADSDHTHNYAGSSTSGGSANSAVKLDSSAGSATNPVYFSNGIPVKTTYTLGKSVPSDAVFTDTVYNHPTYTAQSSGLYKIAVNGTGHVSSATAVTKSDITDLGIPAQDTVYTLPSAGTELGGVKSGGDVTISGGVITVNDDSHNHTIANVDGLQAELAAKALKTEIPAVIDNLTSTSTADALSAYQGKVLSDRISAINTNMEDLGAGDMLKSVYDTDGDGIVDNAEKLGGQLPAYYATASNLTSHANNKSNPHGVTAAQVGADPSGTAAQALIDANAYTDTRLSELVNSAPTTLDTLGEIATAMAENAEVVEALENAIGNKADSGHTHDDRYYTESEIDSKISTLNTAISGKSDSGHTHNYAGSSTAGGSANSAVKLDSSAGTATQPVYFSNGKPVATTYTLGKSVPSDAVFTDTVYTHPTHTAKSNGLYKITVDGTGHVSSTTAVEKSDITALGIPAQDTTYTLSSFGITATAAEINKLDGLTATTAELNYVDGVTSNIQTQINNLLNRIAVLEAAIGFSTNESDM